MKRATVPSWFPFLAILALAFFVRVIGIGYALPLWLVGDEPAFVFGALKMLELKTVLPVIHAAAFQGTFYYAPYLAHLYLLPFALLIGIKWVLFSGSMMIFKDWLLVNLSGFFLIGRRISVFLGTATVWIVYRTARNIFQEEAAALGAATALAFSLLHTIFSHWGRHWVPATFIFSLIVYALSHSSWGIKKRYLIAATLCGLGIGVSVQVGLTSLFILAWFFIVDKISLKQALSRAWVWQCVLIFIFLTVGAYAIWPAGFYVARGAGTAITSGKTLAGLLSSYSFYFHDLLIREPVFLFLILLGSVWGWRRAAVRQYLITVLVFLLSYIAIFYLLFLNLSRFLLVFYPLGAAIAGYGLAQLWSWIALRHSRLTWVAVCLMVLGMLAPVLKFDWLLWRNDTRIETLAWVDKHIPAGARVIVLSPLLRLPATPESNLELAAIDPTAPRAIDQAEGRLSLTAYPAKRWQALNLNANSIKDLPTFFPNFGAYLKTHAYDYIIYTPEFASKRGVKGILEATGREVKRFAPGEPVVSDLLDGQGGGLLSLWRSEWIGPEVIVKKL